MDMGSPLMKTALPFSVRFPGRDASGYYFRGVCHGACTVSGVLLAYTGKSHTLWVLFIAILVASLDEYIQQFSGGRTSTWHDVILDSVGCMAGILLVCCIRVVYRLMKR